LENVALIHANDFSVAPFPGRCFSRIVTCAPRFDRWYAMEAPMIPAPATTTRFTRAALAGNPVMSGTESNSSSLRRSIDILEYSLSNPAIIGIDLGTTNCALAFTREDSVDVFPIPQLVNPGEVREEPLLPSFLFLEGDPPIVGVLAQKRGLENAGRLVSSAKSWLSHAGVDRTAAILPPNAPEGVPKISPVEASRRYLAHLRDSWNTKTPDASFDAHQVLVTVPASFDAVARDLTLKAAEEAGYRNVILLEEPQAAFYAWLERHPDWRDRVGVGDLILSSISAEAPRTSRSSRSANRMAGWRSNASR
jgi:hypothetical protein